MRFSATHECPPIPDRSYDWSAVDESTYDGFGCSIGYGPTALDAVKDLMEQLEERGRPKGEIEAAFVVWLQSAVYR